MLPRDTVICTVGTSLFFNLRTAPEVPPRIQSAFQGTEWERLGQELAKLEPRDRLCGAEINTLEELRTKSWISLERIIFLVSDTEEGRAMGRVLTAYFKARRDIGIRADALIYRVIEGLQDERPREFKAQGLRNLVREIGAQVQKFGHDRVVVDATGGYKAQIAIAVIMGQVLNIPVLYKHERFSEIIDFPPLPVAFDYDFLGSQADLLVAFERGALLTATELGEVDEKLRVLLNEVDIDGETAFDLSPVGQIYLMGYRLRLPKQAPTLTPASSRTPPSFGSHHYPRGFEDFVKKVWTENGWIQTIHSLPYEGQAQIRKGISFRVQQVNGEPALVGSFKPDDFGARFRVRLENEQPAVLSAAAVALNDRYQPAPR
ncbi:MAG: putative CRISPR-associated protein [Chloroflexota bacterium]|nr:putative CRISPR-associated protein [Dehalococcoidia bacterium]MDW8252460.1 putative CRISPR-associated protein [Chloroflexota bacterium]